jgi:hypothetical protein
MEIFSGDIVKCELVEGLQNSYKSLFYMKPVSKFPAV